MPEGHVQIYFSTEKNCVDQNILLSILRKQHHLEACFYCKNFEGLLLLKRHQFEINFPNIDTFVTTYFSEILKEKKTISLFSDPKRQNVKIKSQFQWTSTPNSKRRGNVLVLPFFSLAQS